MNVIPQIFYDLIARIIPATGILFLISITILLFDKENGESLILILRDENFEVGRYLDIWTTLFFGVLTYLLSLILKLPSEWFSELKFIKILFFVNAKTIDTERYYEERELLEEKIKNIPEPWKMFSIVRVKLPDEGYRLLKMLAEIRLCEMLFFGFIILAIINSILLLFSIDNLSFRISMIIIFIASGRSLLQLKYSIQSSFDKSVFMTWRQLIKKNKKSINKV